MKREEVYFLIGFDEIITAHISEIVIVNELF